MRLSTLAAAAALATLATACGGGSSPSGTSPGVRTPPDLAAFLREPVATPSSCPSSESGFTVGRRSPWVGHVDISVFIKPSASPAEVRQLGTTLRSPSYVQHVYYESPAEAYAEFQRLYACWAAVPRSQTPASYRVLLLPTATIAQRNTLVSRVLHDPAVDTASCDPALPCTTIVASASASPSH